MINAVEKEHHIFNTYFPFASHDTIPCEKSLFYSMGSVMLLKWFTINRVVRSLFFVYFLEKQGWEIYTLRLQIGNANSNDFVHCPILSNHIPQSFTRYPSSGATTTTCLVKSPKWTLGRVEYTQTSAAKRCNKFKS